MVKESDLLLNWKDLGVWDEVVMPIIDRQEGLPRDIQELAVIILMLAERKYRITRTIGELHAFGGDGVWLLESVESTLEILLEACDLSYIISHGSCWSFDMTLAELSVICSAGEAATRMFLKMLECEGFLTIAYLGAVIDDEGFNRFRLTFNREKIFSILSDLRNSSEAQLDEISLENLREVVCDILADHDFNSDTKSLPIEWTIFLQNGQKWEGER